MSLTAQGDSHEMRGGPSNSLFPESKILSSQRFHEIMFIVLKSLSLELDNADNCMSL